jgi:uncharacterized protein (DUF983 family)
MSHPCSGPSCPNGDCTGCRNGNLWCGDPRCSPNCPGCQSNVNTWSVIVIIIVVIIALIIIGIAIWMHWRINRPATLQPIYPIQPVVSAQQLAAPAGVGIIGRSPPGVISTLPGNVKINASSTPLTATSGHMPLTSTGWTPPGPLTKVSQPVIAAPAIPITASASISTGMIGGNLGL